jgi:uncharacterized protein (DUF1810 family)
MTLQRFLGAQEQVIDTVMAELRAGRKRSHWMWFIFPQLKGLGHSATAQFYGIEGLEEARAYFAHPVLGPRLVDCTQTVLRHAGTTANAIFGSPDDLKFCSCMTLFGRAVPDQPVFKTALDGFCGKEDQSTIDMLGL